MLMTASASRTQSATFSRQTAPASSASSALARVRV